MPVSPNNQILIRKWTVSANPNVANTTSTAILRINHPQNNHQGGSLKFGPDGDLYIGLGDGGGGNDFNGGAGSNTDGHNNTIGNGQDTTVPFGKILRIDPNGTNSANGLYGIPATNPFASGSGGDLKEIYAYGFRNPYRFSFDSATGDFWVGDVGQDNREEIDKVTLVANGGNYGWPFVEGTRDNTADSGRSTTKPADFSSIDPIGEYTHDDGIATIGGFVYRGSLVPALEGKYVFGDLEPSTGRLFYMDTTTGAINEFTYDWRSHTYVESVWLWRRSERRTLRLVLQWEYTGVGAGAEFAIAGTYRAATFVDVEKDRPRSSADQELNESVRYSMRTTSSPASTGVPGLTSTSATRPLASA